MIPGRNQFKEGRIVTAVFYFYLSVVFLDSLYYWINFMKGNISIYFMSCGNFISVFIIIRVWIVKSRVNPRSGLENPRTDF